MSFNFKDTWLQATLCQQVNARLKVPVNAVQVTMLIALRYAYV